MDKQEINILQTIDEIVRAQPVRDAIGSVILRVENMLIQDAKALLSWEPVPLATYGRRLPGMIRSCWVFAIHAQANTGAERHPNSLQRMMSYRGSGDLQIWTGERWRSNPLVSDLETQIENRWISIPPNIWHQAVVTRENWIVVSFHTVPEDELIEERPDENDIGLTHQRKYFNG
jgi:hypothetical protein